jgi:ribosome-associated translation inhibitor RaiA
MKIAISYKHVTLPQPLESALEKHIQKINALLKTYAPDLVHLHGTLERNPHRVEFSFSANLSLPTGSLHASAVAPRCHDQRAKGPERAGIADQKAPGASAQTL